MNAQVVEPRKLRLVPGSVQRRWRLAGLVGFALMLVLGTYAILALGPGADANQMVTVTRAAKPILAGTTITPDELTTGQLRTQDSSLLATLLLYSNRDRIIGQVADADIAAGDLVPADIVSTQATAGLWKLHVPVREMPSDLAPGDHVAILVIETATNGSQVEVVYMQDVRVLSVGQGSADLWIPAQVVPQLQYFVDHGGIALAAMQPGAVQDKIPAGISPG